MTHVLNAIPAGDTVFSAVFDAFRQCAEVETTQAIAAAYLAAATDLYPDLDLTPVTAKHYLGLGNPDALGWTLIGERTGSRLYLAIDGPCARAVHAQDLEDGSVRLRQAELLDRTEALLWDTAESIDPQLSPRTGTVQRFILAYTPFATDGAYRVLDLLTLTSEPAGSDEETALRRAAAFNVEPRLYTAAWGLTGEAAPMAAVQTLCDARIGYTTPEQRTRAIDRYHAAAKARANQQMRPAPSREAIGYCQGLAWRPRVTPAERRRVLGILKAGATRRQLAYLIDHLKRSAGTR